jgi:hypothetical protein
MKMCSRMNPMSVYIYDTLDFLFTERLMVPEDVVMSWRQER